MVFFSYFNTVFNMVFNMPNINIFNTPWNFDIAFNMRYSFQHMLKFSTCCFNIVFYTYYIFQLALKFSTCFYTPWNQQGFEPLQCSTFGFKHTTGVTVFRTFWIFNILFYSFQNILKFSNANSLKNILKFSTCFFTVFRTCWKFQHALMVWQISGTEVRLTYLVIS